MSFTKGQKIEAKIPEYAFHSVEVEIEHTYISKSGDTMVIYSFKNHLGQFRDSLCLEGDLQWYIKRNK